MTQGNGKPGDTPESEREKFEARAAELYHQAFATPQPAAPPKGQMIQPRVHWRAEPDRPNSPRHDELRRTWVAGEAWETCIVGQSIWCPCGPGGLEPLWDHNQDYRRVK